VHFALSRAQRKRLTEAEGDDDAIMDLIEEIEGSTCGTTWSFETDKAWDALHRCFTDGTLTFERREEPLGQCFLGGIHLHGGDYVVSSIAVAEVGRVAAALANVDRRWLRVRYDRIDPADYGPGAAISDEDFEYTWSSFEGLPEFFARAAAARRDVIFTVDA
jgi:hypothetical protein